MPGNIKGDHLWWRMETNPNAQDSDDPIGIAATVSSEIVNAVGEAGDLQDLQSARVAQEQFMKNVVNRVIESEQ